VESASGGNTPGNDDSRCRELLQSERDYLDRTLYRAVHFHGSRLADSLAKAADFLVQLEKRLSREPCTLCMTVQYSWEDEATDLAWRATIVLGQSVGEGDAIADGEPVPP